VAFLLIILGQPLELGSPRVPAAYPGPGSAEKTMSSFIEKAIACLRILSLIHSAYVLVIHKELQLSIVFFSVFFALAMARGALPVSSMTRYINEDKCEAVRRKYGLTSLGFLPLKPVGILPEEFDAWEKIMRELPELNRTAKIRERIDVMPCLELTSIGNDEVSIKCVISSSYEYPKPTPALALALGLIYQTLFNAIAVLFGIEPLIDCRPFCAEPM